MVCRKVALVSVLALLCASSAEAGLFGWLRPRARCGVACQPAVAMTGAVQKIDDGPVQKEDAVQKTEPVPAAVQKEDATQKDAEAPVVVMGPLQALCLRKARIQAARGGRCFHVGGGFGGARAEGVGSGVTAAAALNACCFTGQRVCVASAVVRSAAGRYYACKLFR